MQVGNLDERNRVKALILHMVQMRGPTKTICPSEAARKYYGGEEAVWRAKMPFIRDIARELVEENVIEVTQKGSVVDITVARGPIRLRLKAQSQLILFNI
eukprot:TRINITY_DN6250_c0_g1_i2.p2 TRINITY_DN6250_c0_g1~~TRINITY_DN6250_c0_g1_i2.p2  ORF type:complete len:100 (+),score=5.20 TRINITY_DN6250_c0_g1_i2:154-453(+)